jgi:hypothetical protein
VILGRVILGRATLAKGIPGQAMRVPRTSGFQRFRCGQLVSGRLPGDRSETKEAAKATLAASYFAADSASSWRHQDNDELEGYDT